MAWAVTRVHAGKLFLFICSMLPWRIDISHEFTWGKRRGKEGRGKGKEKGKEEGRRSSPWRGRGRRTISFSAFSQNDAYFSYVSCFSPPPTLRRRRGLNVDTRNESCATMEASITSKNLLENCYYYFFIIAGILELSRWKYGLISVLQIFFFVNSFFSREIEKKRKYCSLLQKNCILSISLYSIVTNHQY